MALKSAADSIKKTFLLLAHAKQTLAIRNGFEIALEFFMSIA